MYWKDGVWAMGYVLWTEPPTCLQARLVVLVGTTFLDSHELPQRDISRLRVLGGWASEFWRQPMRVTVRPVGLEPVVWIWILP